MTKIHSKLFVEGVTDYHPSPKSRWFTNSYRAWWKSDLDMIEYLANEESTAKKKKIKEKFCNQISSK